jgi:flagellar protein FlbD
LRVLALAWGGEHRRGRLREAERGGAQDLRRDNSALRPDNLSAKVRSVAARLLSTQADIAPALKERAERVDEQVGQRSLSMISLTRLDGKEFFLNADHILTIERTPDTVIATSHGVHFLVREPVEAVVAKVVAFRRQILHGPMVVEHSPDEA